MSETIERSVASTGSVAVCLALFAVGLCVPPAIKFFDCGAGSDVASAVRERDEARREVARLAFEIGVLREFIRNSAIAEAERHQ